MRTWKRLGKDPLGVPAKQAQDRCSQAQLREHGETRVAPRRAQNLARPTSVASLLRRSPPGLRTMGAEDWGIGHEVSGVTSTGEKFSGEVYTFDEGTGIAVLRTKGDIVNSHDVRVLNTAGCVDVKSVAPKEKPTLEKLPVVDEARNQKREAAAIKAAQASAGARLFAPARDRTSPRPRASRDNKTRARACEETLRSVDRFRPSSSSLFRRRFRTADAPPVSTRAPSLAVRSEHRRRRDPGGAGHLRRVGADAAVRVGRARHRGDGRGAHTRALR